MLKQIIKLKSKYSNFILIFLALSIAFSLIYYKEIDAQNIKNEKIDLCCTWGSELKDNVLTYKIEKGTKDHEKITASAFSEWENNLNNIHFLALSTETSFDEGSEQYEFAKQDLEKYSKDPFIDWIIVFYHQYIYGSGSGLPEEKDFRETYHPLFDKYKVDLALQGHLHVYERTYPITFNDDDEDEPIVQDSSLNIYKNPKGTIFLTVGTGGAHDMQLSSLKAFSAEGFAGDFGILNIEIENDQTPLSGEFIENGKKQKILDEFKIIKDSN